MLGSEQAQALHAQYPAIDLHADTLMWARWWGYDLHKRHEPPLPRGAWVGNLDLPRMRDGGMGAQFFGLVSVPYSKRARGLTRVIHEQIDELDSAISRHPDKLRLVRTAAEVEACR